MKIIIQNQTFSYDTGCALLKMKYGDTPFPGLEDIWDDIQPITFKDILSRGDIQNVEQRRVAINCLGTDKFLQEVKSEIISSESIDKTTTWVNSKGELETKEFVDTYELHKIDGLDWAIDERDEDLYFVKCKDTSTDREYMLWIDPRAVAETNNIWWGRFYESVKGGKITAIDCIAWTIQVPIAKDYIKEIIRQGDCILVKPKDGCEIVRDYDGEFVWRSLTGKEYIQYLSAES
jgi:hypothetical protein